MFVTARSHSETRRGVRFTNYSSRRALELPVNSDSKLIKPAAATAFDQRLPTRYREAMSLELDGGLPRACAYIHRDGNK